MRRGVGGSPTQASKLRQLRRNIASRGGRGCATRVRVVAGRREFAPGARARVAHAGAARAQRARVRDARAPWIPRLARRAAGRRCLTGGARLIDFANAESCVISRCSALLRPPAEVGGTTLRSVTVSDRRGAGNADEEPSHARCKRARGVLAGRFLRSRAQKTQLRLQPHRAAQRSVECVRRKRAHAGSRRSSVRLRSLMRVRGMGLADLVHLSAKLPVWAADERGDGGMSEYDSGSGRKGFVHDVMRRISSSGSRPTEPADPNRDRGAAARRRTSRKISRTRCASSARTPKSSGAGSTACSPSSRRCAAATS